MNLNKDIVIVAYTKLVVCFYMYCIGVLRGMYDNNHCWVFESNKRLAGNTLFVWDVQGLVY